MKVSVQPNDGIAPLLTASDANRTDSTPRVRDLVISPENARSRIESFLRKARASLDIYDPNVSDDGMLALLAKKAARVRRVERIFKENWKLATQPSVLPCLFAALCCSAMWRSYSADVSDTRCLSGRRTP